MPFFFLLLETVNSVNWNLLVKQNAVCGGKATSLVGNNQENRRKN